MVFQNYALYPHMTVADNIGYALKVAGTPKAERLARVEATAKSVGLAEFLDRKPGQLSGGQRQRVAMARAIIREPKVFLFDEPLSNLDAKLRVQMRHEIRRIHNAVGATSIFVTHDQHEGMTLADRLVIMNKGTIEQIGTPEEIYEHPASLYVAGFVGSPTMNILPGTVAASGVSVLLADGQTLDIQSSFKALPGQLVQIGLRPEKLSITRKDQGLLKAKFQFFEDLGSARIYHLEIEDIPVGVVSDLKLALTEGEEVDLAFPPSALHVFDGPSGRSLERAGAMREVQGTGKSTPGLTVYELLS
jgi:sn-glycerol 3-phosphate transport system ATP-binding protein